ncbi:ferredoxin reductase [Mycobacterium sp. NPDC003449]
MVDGVRSRLPWRVARVVESIPETGSARTIRLVVPGWDGHLAGQHIDLKLTAEDGYSAQRSYSLSRPADGERIELTVQQITDGEVSPYLTSVRPGEEIELRGPIGGWFVWRPREGTRILLVAGGSGIVPLRAMLLQRLLTGNARFWLVYSVRTPADVYYADELAQLERDCDWLHVTVVYTRSAAPGTTRPPGRIGPGDLAAPGWPCEDPPRVYVCGPTGFVESVTTTLIGHGHSPAAIRTERFGPSG